MLNFRSAKHDLDPNYKSNGQVLAEVRKVMDEITGDKNIKVTQLSVVGYASPEGTFSYNKALAERRSNSFAQYLAQRYSLPTNQLQVSGYGEDWVKTLSLIHIYRRARSDLPCEKPLHAMGGSQCPHPTTPRRVPLPL